MVRVVSYMEYGMLLRSSNSSTASTTVQNEVKGKVLVLKLKEPKKDNKIQWAEDTIDNENLGRKSSKRCCIFHKRKSFAESDSDESDSDTDVAKKQELTDTSKPKNYQRFHA